MSQKPKREDGLGLVELIIYMALTLIILSAVGGVVISMVSVQNQVMGSANAAEQAQLISRSINSGVRNSTAVQLQAVNGVDQILRVRTASGSSTAVWSCQAWYFNAAEQSLRMKTSGNAIPTPSQSDLTGWTLLASGVSPVQGQTIFLQNGTKLSIIFSEHVANETPIIIRTSVSQRGGVRISAPCF
jgi:hypothetical protein